MNLTETQKQKVESLLEQMTLEEKIGQMNLESPSIVGGFELPFEEILQMRMEGRIPDEEFRRIMSSAERDFHEDEIRAGRIGALMINDPRKCNELQKIAVEESRLGIPLLVGYDVIHGHRDVYPIAIAEAGSFDEDLFEETAKIAAKEARAYGINWTYSPMLDVAHDSRWGRVAEGPGEDPYLASRFAERKIAGQQDDQSDVQNYVAACIKHYVAYGACESGKDYNTTSMAISMLHNMYLPPFKAAVEKGAVSVMASFNDLNGIPCTVNEYTLKKVLKDTYGLDGFVVSDANAVRESVPHGIAVDDADAGRLAVNAGLDMDMGTNIYKDHLKELLESGKVRMETIDEAVRRILSVKVWLGLFESPYVPEEVIEAYEKELPPEHVEKMLEAAEKSVVLLKNEGGVLPLDKTKKISLVGSLAGNKREVCGTWAMAFRTEDCVSILDGLENSGADVTYHACCGPDGEIDEAALEEACKEGDVLVAVVGEYSNMTGEAASRADTTLPGKQRKMLERLVETGKPVVTILMNGRPLALSWEAEHLPVIVEGWQLGTQMGNAIARVLFGEVNPSGKLAASFPFVTGQCPIYYNHVNTGKPGGKSKFTSRYLDAPFEALYPFGYGLSYTTFAYDQLVVEEKEKELEISVSVKNTGDRTGTETVQLYMQDVTASLVRPVKELKGFQKVELKPGEEKKIVLTLKKEEMGFYDNEAKYRLEEGKFRIYVGGNSRDTLCEEIEIARF